MDNRLRGNGALRRGRYRPKPDIWQLAIGHSRTKCCSTTSGNLQLCRNAKDALGLRSSALSPKGLHNDCVHNSVASINICAIPPDSKKIK